MRDNTADKLDNVVFLVDIFFTITIFLVSFWVRNTFIPSKHSLDFFSHLFLIPLILVFTTSFLSYFGGYKSPERTNLAGYSWSIFRAIVLTISALLAILFFLHIQYISRFVIFIFAFLELCTLLVIRTITLVYFKEQVKSGKKSLRVLIIGSRSRARELVLALQEQMVWGVNVVGFVDPDASRVGSKMLDIPVIGTVENIHDCLKVNVIDEVIVAIPRSLLNDAEPIVMACEEEGIKLRFMADIFNVKMARISLSEVKGIPLLAMEPVAQDPQQLFAKRIFDLTCTLLSLPFLVPIFVIVAIIIKLDSPGPVFFIQPRVGMRKHVFPMFKFRSMQINAEEQLKDIEHLNEAEGPIFKIKNDPRITRVGHFLRKTSIDELPQLINVFRGEMSLVGPRPMSLRDVDRFERGVQRKRFSVQPGLTCIWQISGRSNLPFEKWLELDLEYIENWSFWLDLKILLKTIPAVIKSKGAA
ncbi:MAG: sugar transferase [Candidatus Omnitrophica bacterium]|nr:sugar transferase [Candidatus Omnitrophota bacterium]